MLVLLYLFLHVSHMHIASKKASVEMYSRCYTLILFVYFLSLPSLLHLQFFCTCYAIIVSVDSISRDGTDTPYI